MKEMALVLDIYSYAVYAFISHSSFCFPSFQTKGSKEALRHHGKPGAMCNKNDFRLSRDLWGQNKPCNAELN